MPLVGFEPMIAADRAATGTGEYRSYNLKLGPDDDLDQVETCHPCKRNN